MADNIQNIKIRITTDADFSDLDQSLQKLTAEEKALKDQIKGVDEAAKQAGKSLEQESHKATAAVNTTSKGFTDLKDQVKGLAQNIPGAFQAQQILGFANSLKGASAATGGLSGAMNILKIAIASTGIGLIVLALAGLVTYLTQSESGGDKLAKIMTVLKAVFGQVLNVLISLGEKVFDFIEISLEGFEKLVSYLNDFVFAHFDALAKILSILGFEDAAKAVNEFSDSLKKGQADLEKYTQDIIQLASELADLEDELGARTIDIAIANNRLTTEIDKTLKSLRNRNNTYKENLELIEKVSDAEKQRLAGSLSLIDLELKAKEKNFLIEAGNTELSKQQFKDFVSGKLSAYDLLNNAQGQVTEKTVSDIGDILNKQIDANRQSLVLEEKLQNLRDANELNEQNKQKAREAERKKEADAEKKRLADLAAIEERDRQAYEKILELKIQDNINYNNRIASNDQNSYKTRVDAAQNSYLLESELLEEKLRFDLQNEKLTFQERALLQAKFDSDNIKNTQSYEDELQKIKKDSLDKQQAEDKKIDDEKKARREQEIQAATQAAITIANGLFQLRQQNLASDLTLLQQKQQQELKAVGDNKQAQAVINARYQREEAKIKTKEAQNEKAQALFNIGVSTAQNVVKAYPNPVLIALAVALGVAQAAIVSSKPIPKFKDGSKGLSGGNGGIDDILLYANKGEGIMPTDRMRDYQPAFNAIFDRKVPSDFLNSIVMNYDRIDSLGGRPGNVDMSGLKSEIRNLGSKLDKLQILQVNMDKKGFNTYLKSENSKSQLENNYLRAE